MKKSLTRNYSHTVCSYQRWKRDYVSWTVEPEYRVSYALSLVDNEYTFILRRKRDHGHRKCEVRAKSRWYASYVIRDAIA